MWWRAGWSVGQDRRQACRNSRQQQIARRKSGGGDRKREFRYFSYWQPAGKEFSDFLLLLHLLQHLLLLLLGI